MMIARLVCNQTGQREWSRPLRDDESIDPRDYVAEATFSWGFTLEPTSLGIGLGDYTLETLDVPSGEDWTEWDSPVVWDSVELVMGGEA